MSAARPLGRHKCRDYSIANDGVSFAAQELLDARAAAEAAAAPGAVVSIADLAAQLRDFYGSRDGN